MDVLPAYRQLAIAPFGPGVSSPIKSTYDAKAFNTALRFLAITER
jgi:hypothetical protein